MGEGEKQMFKIVNWLQHTIVRDVATPPLATGSTLAANASPAPFAGASMGRERQCLYLFVVILYLID